MTSSWSVDSFQSSTKGLNVSGRTKNEWNFSTFYSHLQGKVKSYCGCNHKVCKQFLKKQRKSFHQDCCSLMRLFLPLKLLKLSFFSWEIRVLFRQKSSKNQKTFHRKALKFHLQYFRAKSFSIGRLKREFQRKLRETFKLR